MLVRKTIGYDVSARANGEKNRREVRASALQIVRRQRQVRAAFEGDAVKSLELIEEIRASTAGIADASLRDAIVWLCNYAVDENQRVERFFTMLQAERATLSGLRKFTDDKIAALEKERDELRERLTIAEARDRTLSNAVVFAEDYISHFELENDIGKPEFLYIRDAAKCLREIDCV